MYVPVVLEILFREFNSALRNVLLELFDHRIRNLESTDRSGGFFARKSRTKV